MSNRNVSELFKVLSGQEPTPAFVNRIHAIAHAMGVDHDDPYLFVLVQQEFYLTKFSNTPEEVAIACADELKRAGDSMAALAKTTMGSTQTITRDALAKLVPAVEKQLSGAATATLNRIQLGRSLLSIFAGQFTTAVVFFFGFMFGSELVSDLHNGRITAAEQWQEVLWGPGVAIVSGMLLTYFTLSWTQSDRIENLHRGELTLGALGLIGLFILLSHELVLSGLLTALTRSFTN